VKACTMLVVTTTIALASTGARAAAADPGGQAVPRPEGVSPARRIDTPEAMWRFELGYRGNFVTDAGYNPFSTKDYLGQVSIAATRTVFVRGRFSFAPGLAWDYGSSNATARGDASSLQMHRLEVPLEGRVHFGRWGYALLRAAPGVAMESVEIDDASLSAPLTKNRWLFAGDVSAGYAVPLWAQPTSSGLTPQLWAQADGGYGWVVEQHLDLSPGDGQGAGGVDLGSLTMRGAFVRLSAAVSF
jgi:hypothetical protein